MSEHPNSCDLMLETGGFSEAKWWCGDCRQENLYKISHLRRPAVVHVACVNTGSERFPRPAHYRSVLVPAAARPGLRST